MAKNLHIDMENGAIVMSKAFAKKASVYDSIEYNMLQGARADYPEYKIVMRSINKNEKQEHFRGLTYEYIERYIGAHDNSEERMMIYKELRLIAECHSVRYQHIKRWFLETYPEVRKFGMDNASQSKNNVLHMNIGEDKAAS